MAPAAQFSTRITNRDVMARPANAKNHTTALERLAETSTAAGDDFATEASASTRQAAVPSSPTQVRWMPQSSLTHAPDEENQASQPDGNQAQQLNADPMDGRETGERRRHVPCRVQQDCGHEGTDYWPAQNGAAGAFPLSPDNSTHEPGPGRMSNGRQQRSDQECHLKVADSSLRPKESHQTIAHAFQSGETHPAGDAKEQTVSFRGVAPAEIDRDWNHQLGTFLNNTHTQ